MDARYENVRRVPQDRLRPIGAGKLAKMTDINAQWRIEIMTEVYGLCGIGWKYEIGTPIHQAMPDGQILLYLPVSVYVKDGATGEWSAPITQFGGDWLIKKEKEKLVGQDEAYKKCLTDALGKALSVLGVAGDIYAGCWDGAKYTEKTVVDDGKPETVRKAEQVLGGEAIPIEYVQYNNGLTYVLSSNGEWYSLVDLAKAGKLNALNTMVNDERFKAAHDEIRELMASMS